MKYPFIEVAATRQLRLCRDLSCFIALEIIGLCPVGGALAPLPASLRAEKGEVG